MKPDNEKFGTWIDTPQGRIVERRKWKRFKTKCKIEMVKR
jgi:hypothetical protein